MLSECGCEPAGSSTECGKLLMHVRPQYISWMEKMVLLLLTGIFDFLNDLDMAEVSDI